MSKLVRFSASLVVFSCLALMGDRALAQGLMIGGRAGINLANMSVDPASNGVTYTAHAGIVVGAQLDIWLTNSVAIGAQLLYDQKGTHEDINFTQGGISITGSGDIVFNYLEIPILAKVNLISEGGFRPYVFAGPAFGLYLSGTSSGGGGSESVKSSDVSTLDLSIDAGLGAAFRLPSGMSLGADATYALGLTNTNTNGSTNVKTKDLRIMAFAMFPLK